MSGRRDPSAPMPTDDLPARGKVVERSAHAFGAHLRVYRKRQDGYRRIELEFFDASPSNGVMSLYFTDDEFAQWHAAFAPEPTMATEPFEVWEKRWDREHPKDGRS